MEFKYNCKLSISRDLIDVLIESNYENNYGLILQKYFVLIKDKDTVLSIINADSNLIDFHNNQFKSCNDGGGYHIENENELFSLKSKNFIRFNKGKLIIKKELEEIGVIETDFKLSRRGSLLQLFYNDLEFEWIALLFSGKILRDHVHPYDTGIA